MKESKIAIIGAGLVGSTIAYTLMLKNVIAEIILVDIDEVRCTGEVLDLSDALAFCETSIVRSGTSQDASLANIIIIAAGKNKSLGKTVQNLHKQTKKLSPQ